MQRLLDRSTRRQRHEMHQTELMGHVLFRFIAGANSSAALAALLGSQSPHDYA
jgi:hypothetical protein